MDMNELQHAWKQVEQKLTQQNAIQMAMLREKHLGNTRSQLRPLFWGMVIQAVFGLVSVLFAAPFWIRNLETPVLWLSGLTVHVYGILMIALAGLAMHQINRIDLSSPVVTIQKQLLKLKKTYIGSGWLIGIPWWLLWLPFTVIVSNSRFGLFTDGLPVPFVWISLACLLGMLLTIGVIIWAQNPKRPRLAAKMETLLAGVSLTNAQRSLDELNGFESHYETNEV